MNKILFVDDDPLVLAGLQNMLRRQRRRWSMTFVTSGPAALTELDREPTDLLISDMRMPGMDGAELLAFARERHPLTTRLILSGQADHEAIIRSLPVSQLSLSKPCQPDTLVDTISRILAMRNRCPYQLAPDLFSGLSWLLDPPATYWALRQAAARVEMVPADLATIINGDPGMAQVFKSLATAPELGMALGPLETEELVQHLGIWVTNALVLLAHALVGLGRDFPHRLRALDTMKRHSLMVARHVHTLLDDPKEKDTAFTAALLHELGRMAFISPVQRMVGPSEGRDEERSIGHSCLSAYILAMWGMPIDVLEAVGYHHEPSQMLPPPSRPAAALHIVDSRYCDETLQVRRGEPKLDWGYLEQAGMAEVARTWLASEP